jgi:hypothetical protein
LKEEGIFRARSEANGVVRRIGAITLAEAIDLRRNGEDVVVCGDDRGANRRLAGHIERTANGNAIAHPPHHASAGIRALPHWQPNPRPPEGHTYMKPTIEKPSERVMQFFTPELLSQFNSTDEVESNAASEAWEAALSAYQRHLHQMPKEIRQLAELDLHDAELCADGVTQDQGPIAMLALKRRDEFVSLAYALADRLCEHPSSVGAPWTKGAVYWLYDEVDLAPNRRPGEFVHRVLLSDGRVLEIPFTAATHQRVPLGELASAQ